MNGCFAIKKRDLTPIVTAPEAFLDGERSEAAKNGTVESGELARQPLYGWSKQIYEENKTGFRAEWSKLL
jgi:hypothetical protein